jgi:hypothetical protein
MIQEPARAGLRRANATGERLAPRIDEATEIAIRRSLAGENGTPRTAHVCVGTAVAQHAKHELVGT